MPDVAETRPPTGCTFLYLAQLTDKVSYGELTHARKLD